MSATDSSATSSSKLEFFTPAGEALDGPQEWLPARLRLPWEAAELAYLTLTRGDVGIPLAVRPVGGRLVVEGDWPRSGPGHYQLLCPERQQSWQVTVPSRKIPPASLERMVDDLQFRLLAGLGLALQKTGGLAGVKLLPPGPMTLAGELLRLRRAITGSQGLVCILRELSRDAHTRLRTTGLVVPHERARRPTVNGVIRSLYTGGVSAEGMLTRVEDTRVVASVDVPENRLVRTLVDQVQRRLRRLRALRGGLGSDLAAEITHLSQALDQAVRSARFLAEVRPLSSPLTHLSMVLLKHPSYRAAYGHLRDLVREPALDLREPGLEAPLVKLPDLYETWGLLHALLVLVQAAQEVGWTVTRQRLLHQRRGQPFYRVLRDAHPAVELEDRRGNRVRAIPQRRYLASGGSLRSLSFTQIPDLALELRRADGGYSVLILDPKYKLDSEESSPQKLDVDKMHAYRDAIRDREGRAVVESACILYPGKSVAFGSAVRALQALPGEDEALRDELRGLFIDWLTAGPSRHTP